MITVILALFSIALANCDDGFSCPDCVKCASIQTNDDNSLAVTLDFNQCKSEALSWACVRSQTVGTTTCPGVTVDNTNLGPKCDELTRMTFNLPAGSTSVKVQVHDGQNNGNFDCGGTGHPNCCGGGLTGGRCDRSGVCQLDIALSTCPGCVSDDQCTTLNDAATCTVGKCQQSRCVASAAPTTTQCRAQNGPCDVAENCDGQNRNCPNDGVAPGPNQVLCRIQDPNLVCDAHDFCDGTNKDCKDGVKEQGFKCRDSRDKGRCDPEDKCDGTTKNCVDIFTTTQTIMKCGQTYDYCGPLKVDSPTFFVDSGIAVDKNTYQLPCENGRPISFGTANDVTWVQLPYPACATDCIPKKCSNGQDISNYETATCVFNASPNGKSFFYLDNKYEEFNTATGTANEQSCDARDSTSTTDFTFC